MSERIPNPSHAKRPSIHLQWRGGTREEPIYLSNSTRAKKNESAGGMMPSSSPPHPPGSSSPPCSDGAARGEGGVRRAPPRSARRTARPRWIARWGEGRRLCLPPPPPSLRERERERVEKRWGFASLKRRGVEEVESGAKKRERERENYIAPKKKKRRTWKFPFLCFLIFIRITYKWEHCNPSLLHWAIKFWSLPFLQQVVLR